MKKWRVNDEKIEFTVIMGTFNNLSEKLLVARCRLGTAVKKTILLASFDRTKSGTNENKIKFKRLIWTAPNDAEDIHTR